jgi:hypothetical protein
VELCTKETKDGNGGVGIKVNDIIGDSAWSVFLFGV